MIYRIANLIILGSFCVLAIYSYQREVTRLLPVHTVIQRPTGEVDTVAAPVVLRELTGYDISEIQALNRLVASFLEATPKRRVKVVPSKPAALPLMASLYPDTASKEEQIALDPKLGDKDVQDKLWGKYTDIEHIEAERKLWE